MFDHVTVITLGHNVTFTKSSNIPLDLLHIALSDKLSFLSNLCLELDDNLCSLRQRKRFGNIFCVFCYCCLAVGSFPYFAVYT